MLAVLLLAGSSSAIESQQLVCWPLARGETAAAAAHRLAGSVVAQDATWFQIRDGRGRLVSKSRYDRLPAGVRACIPRDFLVERVPPGPLVAHRAASAVYNTTFAWQLGVGVSLMLFTGTLVSRRASARRVPPELRPAAEAFVNEFARPLLDPGSATPPIRARLRFNAERDHLEIGIAPASGRRYPNLDDHRHNVAYDVERVLRQLEASLLPAGALRADGEWVVIPVRRPGSHRQV